jgi:Icc-related predicted phosphoesterase
VACFGNNEFDQIRMTAKMKYPDIKFLDDEASMMRIGDRTVGIIGTTGSLDNPTPWQRENIPNIENIFRERVNFVDRQLQRIQAEYKIVLMHYAPTYKSLEGENPRFYGSMGSRAYELVLENRKPTLVIHGHSFRGIKMAWLDTVPVFNVAFAVNKAITIIDTENLKPGLTQFV